MRTIESQNFIGEDGAILYIVKGRYYCCQKLSSVLEILLFTMNVIS